MNSWEVDTWIMREQLNYLDFVSIMRSVQARFPLDIHRVSAALCARKIEGFVHVHLLTRALMT